MLVDLNIQGTIIPGRGEQHSKSRGKFFDQFLSDPMSPGSPDGAPMTYVAWFVAPRNMAAFQSAVVAAFPNVTAINIG